MFTLSPWRFSLSTSGIMEQSLDRRDAELAALVVRQRLDEAVAPRQHARLERRGEMRAQCLAHCALAVATQGRGTRGARHDHHTDALWTGKRDGARRAHPLVLREQLFQLRQRQAFALHLDDA